MLIFYLPPALYLLFHPSPLLFIKEATYKLELDSAGTAADVLERAISDTHVGDLDFSRSFLCAHGQCR